MNEQTTPVLSLRGEMIDLLDAAQRGDMLGEDELTSSEVYVGSFHIFGHGGCYGDVGHCEVRAEPGLYDPRPSHMLTPVKTVVPATEVLRGLVTQGEDIAVTVVPVITSLTEQCDLEDVFKFDRLSIVTYKTEVRRRNPRPRRGWRSPARSGVPQDGWGRCIAERRQSINRAGA